MAGWHWPGDSYLVRTWVGCTGSSYPHDPKAALAMAGVKERLLPGAQTGGMAMSVQWDADPDAIDGGLTEAMDELAHDMRRWCARAVVLVGTVAIIAAVWLAANRLGG